MKISHENLNELKSWEYEEYKSLKKKQYDGEGFGCFAWIFLHITLSLLIATFGQYLGGNWTGIFLTYTFVYPLWFIVTVPVGFSLNYLFNLENFFKKLSQKRPSYRRLQELNTHFDKVEIQLWTQVKEYIDCELNELISELRRNKGNQADYSKLIQTFIFNHEFVKESTDFLKLQGIFSNYKSKLKQQGIWFENELKEAEERAEQIKKAQETLTRAKIPFLKRKNSINTLGINSEWQKTKPKGDNSQITANHKKIIEITDESNVKEKVENPSISHLNKETIKTRTKTTEPIQEIQDSKEISSTLVNPSKTEEFNPPTRQSIFEHSKSELEEIDTTPTKRKSLTKPHTIKASTIFWEELNRKRMTIGKKGELLALDFERKRIAKEEGVEFLQILEHSSITKGDGLGYDILSHKDGKEIYIEVKTTTGSFWSNIVFTENELNVMNHFGNQYYLFRIYELDKNKKAGKLRIFKGRDEITSTFDFSPQTYILKPKN